MKNEKKKIYQILNIKNVYVDHQKLILFYKNKIPFFLVWPPTVSIGPIVKIKIWTI